MLEFYATITNPRLIDNAQTPKTTQESCLAYFRAGFKIIYPKEVNFQNTLDLATMNKVVGRKIFDIYLVSTMLSNEIDTIYTANDKDFKYFSSIKAINPFASRS